MHVVLHDCCVPCSHKGKTPLLCAAEAGHDEIVAYLLQFREVQTYLKYQPEVVKNANVRLHKCLHNLVDICVKTHYLTMEVMNILFPNCVENCVVVIE